MEIGAVGGPSLASQTSISVRGEQKQKGESENDEVRVDKGECKIDILNNDCFMHIFWFLNNRERIKIERGKLFQVFSSYVAFIQSFR
jgi:hypothetical protein